MKVLQLESGEIEIWKKSRENVADLVRRNIWITVISTIFFFLSGDTFVENYQSSMNGWKGRL